MKELLYTAPEEQLPDPSTHTVSLGCIRLADAQQSLFAFSWGIIDKAAFTAQHVGAIPRRANFADWTPGGPDDTFQFRLERRDVNGTAWSDVENIELEPSNVAAVTHQAPVNSWVGLETAPIDEPGKGGIKTPKPLAIPQYKARPAVAVLCTVRIDVHPAILIGHTWAQVRPWLRKVASILEADGTLTAYKEALVAAIAARISGLDTTFTDSTQLKSDKGTQGLLTLVLDSVPVADAAKVVDSIGKALADPALPFPLPKDAASRWTSTWLQVIEVAGLLTDPPLKEQCEQWAEDLDAPDSDGMWNRAMVRALKVVFETDAKKPGQDANPLVRRPFRLENSDLSVKTLVSSVATQTSAGAFREMAYRHAAAYAQATLSESTTQLHGFLTNSRGRKSNLRRLMDEYLLLIYRAICSTSAITDRQKQDFLAIILPATEKLQKRAAPHLAAHSVQQADFNGWVQATIWGACRATVNRFADNLEVRRRLNLAAFTGAVQHSVDSLGVKSGKAMSVSAGMALDRPHHLDASLYIYRATVKWLRKGQPVGSCVIHDCIEFFNDRFNDHAKNNADGLVVENKLIDGAKAWTVESAYWEVPAYTDKADAVPAAVHVALGLCKDIEASPTLKAHLALLRTWTARLEVAEFVSLLTPELTLGADQVLIARIASSLPPTLLASSSGYPAEVFKDKAWFRLRAALYAARSSGGRATLRTTSGDGRIAIRVAGIGGKPLEKPVTSHASQTAFSAFAPVLSPVADAAVVQGAYPKTGPRFTIVPSSVPEVGLPGERRKIASVDVNLRLQVSRQGATSLVTLFDIELPEKVEQAWKTSGHAVEVKDSGQSGAFVAQSMVAPVAALQKPLYPWVLGCFRSGEWGAHTYAVERDPDSPFDIQPSAKGVLLRWAQSPSAPPVRSVAWTPVAETVDVPLHAIPTIQFGALKEYVSSEGLDTGGLPGPRMTYSVIVLRRAPVIDVSQIDAGGGQSFLAEDTHTRNRLLKQEWFATALGEGWHLAGAHRVEGASVLDDMSVQLKQVRAAFGWEYRLVVLAHRVDGTYYRPMDDATLVPVRILEVTGTKATADEQATWKWLEDDSGLPEDWPLDIDYGLSAPSISRAEYLVSQRPPAAPAEKRYGDHLPSVYATWLRPLVAIDGLRRQTALDSLAKSAGAAGEVIQGKLQAAYAEGAGVRLTTAIDLTAPRSDKLEVARSDLIERINAAFAALRTQDAASSQNEAAALAARRTMEVRAAVVLSYDAHPRLDPGHEKFSPHGTQALDALPLAGTEVVRYSGTAALPSETPLDELPAAIKRLLDRTVKRLGRSGKRSETVGWLELSDPQGRIVSVKRLNSGNAGSLTKTAPRRATTAKLYDASTALEVSIVAWTGVNGRFTAKLAKPLKRQDMFSEVAVLRPIGAGAPVSTDGVPSAWNQLFCHALPSEQAKDMLTALVVIGFEAFTPPPGKSAWIVQKCPYVRVGLISAPGLTGTKPSARNDDAPHDLVDIVEPGPSDAIAYAFRHVGPGAKTTAVGVSGAKSGLWLSRIVVPDSRVPKVPVVRRVQALRRYLEFVIKSADRPRSKDAKLQPYFDQGHTIDVELSGRYLWSAEAARLLSTASSRLESVQLLAKADWPALGSGNHLQVLSDWFGAVGIPPIGPGDAGEAIDSFSIPIDDLDELQNGGIQHYLGKKNEAEEGDYILRIGPSRADPPKPDGMVAIGEKDLNIPVREWTEWTMRCRTVTNQHLPEEWRLASSFTEWTGRLRPLPPYFDAPQIGTASEVAAPFSSVKLQIQLKLIEALPDNVFISVSLREGQFKVAETASGTVRTIEYAGLQEVRLNSEGAAGKLLNFEVTVPYTAPQKLMQAALGQGVALPYQLRLQAFYWPAGSEGSVTAVGLTGDLSKTLGNFEFSIAKLPSTSARQVVIPISLSQNASSRMDLFSAGGPSMDAGVFPSAMSLAPWEDMQVHVRRRRALPQENLLELAQALFPGTAGQAYELGRTLVCPADGPNPGAFLLRETSENGVRYIEVGRIGVPV